jgi:hypothetical protein
MSELHKFLFEGLPVRGMLVRLTDSWQDILRVGQNLETGPYPEPVRAFVGRNDRSCGVDAGQHQIRRRLGVAASW